MPTKIEQTPTSPDLRSDRLSWILIGAYILFIGLVLALRNERLFLLLFPASSVGLGIYLYFITPHLYVGFTWCTWFVSAFIYRINEFLSGDTTPGATEMVPALVTLVSGISLIKYLPRTYHRQALPFVLSALGIVYGLLVGIIYGHSLRSSISSALFMITPIFFGFYLVSNWRSYPKFRQITIYAFFLGIIVMGLYGIYQRVTLPEWDLFYLINSRNAGDISNNSLITGSFSTTSGRQQFGGLMLAGIILMFCRKNNILSYSLSGLGFVALLLSQARATWLGFAIAFLIFFVSLKQRLQMRTVFAVTLAAIAFIPLALIEPFSTIISERLETLSNLGDDASLNARREAFTQVANQAMDQVFGLGLGFDLGSITKISNYDGSIFQLLFFLGWFGSLFLVSGIMLLTWKLFESKGVKWDSFAYASRAIFLGIFVQVGFNLIFIGSLAILLWGFLGMTLAARSYYLNNNLNQQWNTDNRMSRELK